MAQDSTIFVATSPDIETVLRLDPLYKYMRGPPSAAQAPQMLTAVYLRLLGWLRWSLPRTVSGRGARRRANSAYPVGASTQVPVEIRTASPASLQRARRTTSTIRSCAGPLTSAARSSMYVGASQPQALHKKTMSGSRETDQRNGLAGPPMPAAPVNPR